MSEWISHDGQPPIAELEPLPAFDITTGDVVQRRWVGSPARIKEKYAELRAQGVRVRVSEALGDMGLQITADFSGVINPGTGQVDPTASEMITEWTSEPATFSKSIWELPAVVAEFQKLGTDDAGLSDARRLRNYIDALLRGETTVPDPQDEQGVKTLPMSPSILLAIVGQLGLSVLVFRAFLRDLFRGVTTFTPASWTLRRTRRVPAVVVFTESSANVGRMLTYSTLLGEGLAPSSLRTALPFTGYWLKQNPVDRPAGEGVREVITEYWWTEEYSTFIYGLPV
ncbi:MAG: hypothetical protein KF791_08320 [Verrucomicrobiae bacterium]|nr:hypothetical protein [Verrucomicrobiae bacterium]